MPKTMLKSQKYKGAKGKKGPVIDKSKIKSASELGIRADSLGISKRKAKSHKGRKILESKQAQIIEGNKLAIFVKGNKTSSNVMELMKDISILRGPETSRLFMRKGYDLHPFEEIGGVETMAQKQGCALFVVGSQQKKRPDNIMFGRLFDDHLLDMFEFGVSNFQGLKQFKAQEVNSQIKPLLSFQGEIFDISEKHKRFKNFLIDLYKVSDYEEANIPELKRVMIFTAIGDSKINCRQFEITKAFSENETHKKALPLNEIGPSYDLTFRRDRIAAADHYKAACKKPKTENPEKKRFRKNTYTDEWGQQKGKVFLQHQDVKTLATRKWRKQKPGIVHQNPNQEAGDQ